MTDEERDAFPNLILLCPNCHRLIDSLEPEQHPVELLEEMKGQHEDRAPDLSMWTNDTALEAFARMAVVVVGAAIDAQIFQAGGSLKAEFAGGAAGTITPPIPGTAQDEARSDDRAG